MAIETEKKYLDLEGLETLVNIINNKFTALEEKLDDIKEYLEDKIDDNVEEYQRVYDRSAKAIAGAIAELKEMINYEDNKLYND